jgi:hypothetical protein
MAKTSWGNVKKIATMMQKTLIALVAPGLAINTPYEMQ